MAHRKVDVDEIVGDEDQFVDEIAAVSFVDLEQLLQSKINDVRSYLQRGDVANALKRSLDDPAYGGVEIERIKIQAVENVYSVLSAVRVSDITNVIKTLSAQQVDVLVKYIYRAMASPATFNASSLLAWHEKAVEVGGFGSIIRCMTDRKII